MISIERLDEIINDPNNSADVIAQAQLEKDRLASVASAKIQVAQATGVGDADILAVLAAMEQALKSGGSKVSASDVRKAVLEEIEKRKITKADLSKELLAFIDSKRTVNFTMSKLMGVSVKEVEGAVLERPLTQLILSDIMARNNTYLYGGAGTGKTYIAEQIAEILGWQPIVLNCNQFTSPLDILGGQTIDGYQEGKLAIAWSNQMTLEDGTIRKFDGCVLILDELPKIDPNTAGILNQALAKVKDYKVKLDASNNIVFIPPTISDAKNRELKLGNLYVIATGNVPLNTIDPDYEANFKQDLSLQDRFIGSTYKVFVDYKFEYNTIMKGFAFIWIFLVKVREAIQEIRASSQAFVSLRLMINAKATYVAYREVLSKSKKTQNIAIINQNASTNSAISNPKTLIDTMDNFFALFKDTQRDTIKSKVDYDAFKRIVEEKNNMPYDSDKAPNFDTASEEAEAERIILDYEKKQKQS